MSVHKRDTKTGRMLKKGETPKGKARWYCIFTVRGKRTGLIALPEATNKKQAEQAEAKIKTEMFEGRYGNPARKISFEKFVREDYLSWAKQHKRRWQQDAYYIEYLVEHFRGKTLADITPELIRKYQQKRRSEITNRGQQRNPSTVNREVALLSKIFSLAVESEHLEANPCKKVNKFKVNNRKERVITAEEEALIRDAVKQQQPKLAPVVILAFNTGMRRGELFNMVWDDVDFEAGLIRIPKTITKNGKGRDLPMSQETRTVLLDLRGSEEARKERVFDFNPDSAGTTFSLICQELKLEGVTLHTIRHTYATRLAEAGIHPFVAQELLGHLRLDMTRYYTHTQSEMKREAVRALENWAKQSLPSCSR